MLTKKQRFDALVNNGFAPNHVLFRPILMQFAAEYIGKTYGEFVSDYRVLVEANRICLSEFDMDMVGLISDPYRETSAFGAQLDIIPNGVPRCLNLMVSSLEGAKALPLPNIFKSKRTLDRIKGAEELAKVTQSTVPIIGWVEGPLAEACDLAGMEFMMCQLMMDPDFCNILMDKCISVAKDFAKAQIEAGCDIIGIGDAVCSQIDLYRYQHYVFSRHKELIDSIHELGAKVKLHICGDINHLLPSLAQLEVDILDLDYQVDLDFARKTLGEKTILCGNINPVDIQNATPEGVALMGKTLVDKYKSDRFILSAGCEISPLTPADSLRALSNSRL